MVQLQRPQSPSRDQGESRQGQEGMQRWTNRVGAEMDMTIGSRGNTPLMTKQFLVIGGVMIAATAYAALLAMVAGLRWANRM